MKIILENIRCSYVFIGKPNKDGKYSVQPLIPKNSKHAKEIAKAVDTLMESKFGADSLKKKARYKLPLRDGDEERDTPEYEGHYFLNANSSKRPGILNRSKKEADQDDIEEYCYSGAYFNVSINLYSFPSTDGGKPGIAAGLNNIMIVKKGPRLDGSVSASKEFEDFEALDEENDDFDDEEL